MLHYQSDVMMNGAILIARAKLVRLPAGGRAALGIGVYILYSALRATKRCSRCWIGRCRMTNARRLSRWFPLGPVKGAHDLRTRQSGPTRFIQLHLEMEDTLRGASAADQVEQALRHRFAGADVIIHRSVLRGAAG